MRIAKWLAALPAAALLAACEVTVKDEADANAGAANQAAQAPAPVPPPMPPAALAERDRGRAEFQDLRFLVDKSERKLRLFLGDRLIETHDVTVGTKDYPTRTGSWDIHRVDLNPEWIPPKDEAWARKETRKAPGAPDNPMGRARLVYDEPRTIHGTDETGKLGERGSHGSIRVANAVVLPLAEMVLKAGGAWQGAPWFAQMTADRTREHKVALEHKVPIVVQE